MKKSSTKQRQAKVETMKTALQDNIKQRYAENLKNVNNNNPDSVTIN